MSPTSHEFLETLAPLYIAGIVIGWACRGAWDKHKLNERQVPTLSELHPFSVGKTGKPLPRKILDWIKS